MNKNVVGYLLIGLPLLVAAANLHAQSSDALLNKLVAKGVLTKQEADELKKEADTGFDKAYRARTGMPEWVTSLKLYGDVRGRYEFFHTENDVPGVGAPNKDRSRYRYRLRVGGTVTMKDDFEMGFRFTSGEPQGSFGGDPISPNATFQDNGSKKFLWVDLAYGKWTPIHTGPWLLSASIGKIENPFVVSDMVFDPDYTPEGAAIQGGYAINKNHALKWSGAVFLLDEIGQGAQASDDPVLAGVQARYDATWTPELTSTLGIGWYALFHEQNLGNAAVPNVNVGNTRYSVITGTHAIGDLVNNYHPFVADASITYTLPGCPGYAGKFPIRIGGEYMHNSGASDDNQGFWGGIFFGKAGKKGTWEASYRYKRLESDAGYEEVVDSDFTGYYATVPAGFGLGTGYRAGTGVQGHILRAAYAVSDTFQIGATYFLTELIDEPSVVAAGKTFKDTTVHRLQMDALWKF
jgi:hypothetical protein